MNMNRLNILLVDDDEDDYILTREMLAEIKLWKIDLEWVPDYDEAINLIRTNNHHVYLFDYRLGKKTGIELLCHAIEVGCTSPIIILTGQDDREVDMEAINAGAADYLVKGQINPSLLERAIRHAIERKQAEEALKTAKDYAENLINSSIDMIIATDMDSNIIEFNPAAQGIFGYQKSEVLGKSIDILYADPSDANNMRNNIFQEKVFIGEVISRKKNSELFPCYMSASILKDLDSHEIGVMSISRDITERKRLEKQLLHNAFHDTLTGLPNRDLFLDRLERVMKHAERNKDYMFAVLFIDIDRFKIINDSLGHILGDQLLLSIAQRLTTCLRDNDTLARLGGDEFTILLDGINKETSARIVAERILKSLETPFDLNGHNVCSSASIGIVLGKGIYEKPEDLLRDADTSMYRAKMQGRARYEIFDQKMHSHVLNLMKLEGDLREAIRHDEFIVYYQPIMSLSSGRIVGLEALIRWRHPKRGIIPPIEFIQLAEETKLIEPMGEFILRKACLQSKAWQDDGNLGLSMAVNVSVSQFRYQRFPDMVKSILKETGMNAENFEMEITESITMGDSEYSIKILNELSSIGIKISMDDFGTGYSAINYLKHFPINTIKIDKSIIRDISVLPEAAAITKAIITMAHSLNKEIIAEGVETEEQLKFLQLHMCDKIQGYLISKPLPADEIKEILPVEYGYLLNQNK